MPRLYAFLLAIASLAATLARAADPADGASDTALAFTMALLNGDLETIKPLVAKSGAGAFKELTELLKKEPLKRPKGVPKVTKIHSDAARTIVTLSFGEKDEDDRKVFLLKEDQSWKIDLQEMMRGDVDAAKRVRAKNDIEELRTQLAMYETRQGALPSTQQGLQALVEKPEGDPQPRRWRQLLPEVPYDAWNTPYQYLSPAKRSKKDSYDLFSAGPDKKPGTDDDIGNW